MMPQSKMVEIKVDIPEMKGRVVELNEGLKAAKNLLLCLGIYDKKSLQLLAENCLKKFYSVGFIKIEREREKKSNPNVFLGKKCYNFLK